jgi:hypothetical protein
MQVRIRVCTRILQSMVTLYAAQKLAGVRRGDDACTCLAHHRTWSPALLCLRVAGFLARTKGNYDRCAP